MSDQGRLVAKLQELHLAAGSPSSRALARKIGRVSHTTVSQILSGKVHGSQAMIQKIFEALGGTWDKEWIDAWFLAGFERRLIAAGAPLAERLSSDNGEVTRDDRVVALRYMASRRPGLLVTDLIEAGKVAAWVATGEVPA